MVNYNSHDPDGQKIMLFTPGPVYVPEFLLKELAKPNDTHRSNPYKELHGMVKEKLQKLLHTKNDVLIWTNSGSGVMEACVRNLLGKEDKGLFLSCGAFGDRWASMAKANGKQFKKVSVEMGKGISPELVEKELSADKYTTVFIQMNETSTGVMNPIRDIAPIVKKHGALICVDAVSCMAGVDINVDEWGLDVCLASTQKCFGLPAGLAISAVSEAAFEKSKSVENKGWYFDFMVMKKKSDLNQTPTTPPSPHIRALNVALDKIFEEGTENRFKRHRKLTSMIREWAKSEGFELFAEPGYESMTVTTITNNKGIDVGSLVKKAIESGYRFVNGYGSLKDKTFRIAAMGWITEEMLKKFLDKLSILIKEFYYFR